MSPFRREIRALLHKINDCKPIYTISKNLVSNLVSFVAELKLILTKYHIILSEIVFIKFLFLWIKLQFSWIVNWLQFEVFIAFKYSRILKIFFNAWTHKLYNETCVLSEIENCRKVKQIINQNYVSSTWNFAIGNTNKLSIRSNKDIDFLAFILQRNLKKYLSKIVCFTSSMLSRKEI